MADRTRRTALLWRLWYVALGIIVGAAIATVVMLPHLEAYLKR